jgi:hypothetical protein
MNSTFSQILGTFKKNKMSENLNVFENLNKNKAKIQPCAEPQTREQTLGGTFL